MRPRSVIPGKTMKSTTSLAAIGTLATWMLICALIAMQNAQPISLEFFGAKLVPVPFGLLLVFMAVLGMVGSIVLQPLFFGFRRRSRIEEDY
jgi:uncharacterized integral membrane protein